MQMMVLINLIEKVTFVKMVNDLGECISGERVPPGRG